MLVIVAEEQMVRLWHAEQQAAGGERVGVAAVKWNTAAAVRLRSTARWMIPPQLLH